jgi:hypothetical protein
VTFSPDVSIREVQELELLARELLLDRFDERPRDRVVVVEPGCDYMRETLHQVGDRGLYHGLGEHAAEVDWPECAPLATNPDALLNSRRHLGMAENQPERTGAPASPAAATGIARFSR